MDDDVLMDDVRNMHVTDMDADQGVWRAGYRWDECASRRGVASTNRLPS